MYVEISGGLVGLAGWLAGSSPTNNTLNGTVCVSLSVDRDDVRRFDTGVYTMSVYLCMI